VAFIVRLAEYAPGVSFERIGLERRHESLLGVEIPTVSLPVHAGSNLATLVDLAIRDWQLRLRGINAARRLDERLRTRGSGEGVGHGVAGEAE
jgi:HPr kinase/phosphorylase